MSVQKSLTKSLTFRFSGKIARLLGRESVSSEIAALLELVKNAYDADAENVEVIFESVTGENGRIRVRDDGIGMTYEDFEKKWMVVGTDSKERATLTKRRGRRVVGEKGIGRFATEKLARKVTIVSLPEGLSEVITLTINWDDYENETKTFDQIVNVAKISSPRPHLNEHGLEIILEGLRDAWDEQKVKKLQREISALIIPQRLEREKEDRFNASIIAPEFSIYMSKIESSIFSKAPYKMQSSLVDSRIHSVIYYRGKKVSDKPIDTDRTSCGPLSMTLYMFPQDPSGHTEWKTYYNKTLGVLGGRRVQDLLEQYSGVKIYRDGFMVRPYGGPGDDWLGLDKERVKRGSKISNKHVIGFVEINRDRNPIRDTTTRERLIEDHAFDDLKKFVLDSIDELNAWREKEKQQEKMRRKRVEHNNVIATQIKNLTETVQELEISEPDKVEISNIISTVRKEITDWKRETESEKEEIMSKERAYRNLASLGIAASAASHEIAGSLFVLSETSKKLIEDLYEPQLSESEKELDLRNVNASTSKIKYFMSFVREFVQLIAGPADQFKKKEDVKIAEVTNRLFAGFDGVIKERNIKIMNNISPDSLTIHINQADLESILINLLTNSLKALKRVERTRYIKLEAWQDELYLQMRFSDNGPGIPESNYEKIFHPFFTTTKGEDQEGGMGLGLSIVQEIVNDYEGIVKVDSNKEFDPGATLVISLPLSKVKPHV